MAREKRKKETISKKERGDRPPRESALIDPASSPPQNKPSADLTHNTTYLLVSVPQQKMRLYRGKRVLATYSISTSKFGIGFGEGSLQTPLGHFCIYAKIGADAALGEIFRGRQATGIIATQGGEEDLVTTRILWLTGLDPENANTRDRYIYIHGTNHENLLGQPASHGCIRMSNIDIKKLFKRVETTNPVFIFNTSFKQSKINFPPRDKIKS